jgi:hypothetical protein
MADQLVQRGYYSVLRWASDPTRDEARNVAVMLVDSEGQFGGLKSAPLSSVSSSLKQQGFLDTLLVGLQQQFDSPEIPDLNKLRAMQSVLTRSLYLSEPQAVAVPDAGSTLQALYRAFVAPKPAPRSQSKGVVLDRVVTSLRNWGITTYRGRYFHDYLFDAVVEAALQPIVIEVLSFASTARDWSTTERDAGHFLFALSHIDASGAAVVKGPSDASRPEARTSFRRVLEWFEREDIPTVSADEINNLRTVVAAGR